MRESEISKDFADLWENDEFLSDGRKRQFKDDFVERLLSKLNLFTAITAGKIRPDWICCLKPTNPRKNWSKSVLFPTTVNHNNDKNKSLNLRYYFWMEKRARNKGSLLMRMIILCHLIYCLSFPESHCSLIDFYGNRDVINYVCLNVGQL